MLQQQIVDYANAQTKAGVSKDTIKSALLSVGWSGADVNESIKSLDSAPALKIEEKKPQATSSMPTITLNDLMSSSKLQPMTAAKTAPVVKKDEKPIISPQIAESKNVGPQKAGGAKILIVVLSVIAIASAGGVGYLYLQNKNLQEKADGLSGQIDQANSQMADLTKQKNALDSEIEQLTGENKILTSKLSFFIFSSGASLSQDVEFSLQGMLTGGGKSLYMVTSDDGIKLSIKNSKDAKVDAALKSFIGTKVEIGGTHLPGSRDASVVSVNGSALTGSGPGPHLIDDLP